jgi:predicted transposase YdaD
MGGTVLEHESKTIFNEGREEGRTEGREEGLQMVTKRMYSKGKTAEEISDMVDVGIETVKQWIASFSGNPTAG